MSPARFFPLSLTLSAHTLAGEIKRISYVSRGKCTGEGTKRATSKSASEVTAGFFWTPEVLFRSGLKYASACAEVSGGTSLTLQACIIRGPPGLNQQATSLGGVTASAFLPQEAY